MVGHVFRMPESVCIDTDIGLYSNSKNKYKILPSFVMA